MRAFARCSRGAGEFSALIMYPLLMWTFFTMVQLLMLEVATLATEHATEEGARAASVILADDPKYWDSPVGAARGDRMKAIEAAVKTPLLAVVDAPVVRVKTNKSAYREGDMVEIEVEFDYPCTAPVGRALVCGKRPAKTIKRVSKMPYQGAGYEYGS